jgi:hypothetical protein
MSHKEVVDVPKEVCFYSPEGKKLARRFISDRVDKVTNHFLEKVLSRCPFIRGKTDEDMMYYVSHHFCHAMHYGEVYAGIDSFLVVGDEITFVV